MQRRRCCCCCHRAIFAPAPRSHGRRRLPRKSGLVSQHRAHVRLRLAHLQSPRHSRLPQHRHRPRMRPAAQARCRPWVDRVRLSGVDEQVPAQRRSAAAGCAMCAAAPLLVVMVVATPNAQQSARTEDGQRLALLHAKAGCESGQLRRGQACLRAAGCSEHATWLHNSHGRLRGIGKATSHTCVVTRRSVAASCSGWHVELPGEVGRAGSRRPTCNLQAHPVLPLGQGSRCVARWR